MDKHIPPCTNCITRCICSANINKNKIYLYGVVIPKCEYIRTYLGINNNLITSLDSQSLEMRIKLLEQEQNLNFKFDDDLTKQNYYLTFFLMNRVYKICNAI